MPRLAAPLPALVLGACLVLGLASCGEEDAQLLPGETAREISSNLDSVQQLVDEGECTEAEEAALEVSTQVESLEGIDAKLKRALEEGAARLNEVVITCQEESEETEEEDFPTTTESSPEPKEKKEKKPKPAKPDEGEEEAETKEDPKTAEPKGEAKGHEEPPVEPPAEVEPPSGGIGPGAEAEAGAGD
jgi:hypothetical protein